MDEDTTRAWVDVDLGALRRNAEMIARRARVPLLAMVKADGYGLGALRVARALEPLAPFGYGVASVAEGRALRSGGIERPILLFTPLLPEAFAAAREARLTPTLGSAERIERWGGAGGGDWHLAIDTGMSREGVRWDELGSLRTVLERHPPAGVFTHLHSADTDDASVRVQEERFRDAIEALPVRPRYLHAENSPALARREPSPWNLARPGAFLYGVGFDAGEAACPEPVAHLRARVVDLRTVRGGDTVSYNATYRASGTRRIATVSAGYADGYRRSLGNCGTALLRGERVPVAGVITMDMTMLDVTGVACEIGDVVTLIGRDGGALLTVGDVAAAAGLSPYELLIGLQLRPARIYHEAIS